MNSAFVHPNLGAFLSDTAAIDARLGARLSRREFFALALAFCAIGISIAVYAVVHCLPFDYNVYILTAGGDLQQYYYSDWILPLFWLWAKFPYWWGFALWSAMNILCLFFAARVFGGHSALPLLTFQFFYSLFLGQITGFLIGMLALAAWAMAHRRWHLAGMAFFLAAAKFQLGLPFGLLLWLTAEIRWRDRLRVLVVPAILALLSLGVSPSWPADLLERIREIPPYDWASISLWHWMGLTALLLLLPPLLLPLKRSRRFLALAAVIPMAVPYFQQADLLVLYVFPIGWLPILLGNLGLLFFEYQFKALQLLWIVPLTAYLSVVLPALYFDIKKKMPGCKNPAADPTSL